MVKTIGNPLSWGIDRLSHAGTGLAETTDRVRSHEIEPPRIRDIDMEDLREALRRGFDDFLAFRSDVVMLCLLYPVIGATLAWFAFDRNLIPLVFPLISGFALIGPVAAVGLYEMSRKREAGEPTGWGDALAVMRSPTFGPIFILGLYLLAMFLLWMLVAHWIYLVTVGPEQPASLAAFIMDVLTSGPGWAMTVLGFAVGFCFAVVVLAVSVVSFPLLLDRNVGLPVAVVTSVRVAQRNPRTVAAWGLIVAAGLVLGSVPVFLGLAIVMPVLGHATWHLYRRAVARPGEAD